MTLIEFASVLKECASGSTISIDIPGRHKMIMKLVGGDLSVSHDEKEIYRVGFKGSTVSIRGVEGSRDACADCLQKCYDSCGGAALCVDKCSLGCPC